MIVGDLFSGIGGFSLGLERAGMRTAWFAETDPFASAVLRKHWPEVPNHGDVRSIRAGAVERVDVLCGGFPCQDISVAGLGRGLEGERSGLWREYARIIGELRPRYVIVENVAALLGRGLDRVLADLAALWYDAEWHVIPAAAVDAPHLRERVWIIAADADHRQRDEPADTVRAGRDSADDGGARLPADADRRGLLRQRLEEHADEQGASRLEPHGLGARGWWDGEATADATIERVEGRRPDRIEVTYARALARLLGRDDAGAFWNDGASEPPLRGADDGVPARLDRGRLACLGNAVVPQIVEMIGRAIIESEA
jgi:DNA (cytosine-5)-methyltransferase 1